MSPISLRSSPASSQIRDWSCSLATLGTRCLDFAQLGLVTRVCQSYRDPERCQITLADFDGVIYRISTPEVKTTLVISVAIRCYSELERYGAATILQREYGSYFGGVPEPGYNVTLTIDLTTLPADREPLIRAISLLKRNIMAAAFEAAFAASQEGRESELMAVHYRDDETIYVKALPDRVTVIFSTEFKDETDKIYGKVFLQEFVDARRQPAIPKCAAVLFPRHFHGANAYDAISRIQLFRDYFHFHIKASKAYMHSRMRTRVETFLKVLNRAKPEKPDDQKEKKTASGKTFKRS
ncbi:hypothetical protein BSLG_006357 [Batrachochytrium salamandrivorans]|nr:hypothetical protein BSLG_006357 [Batrachochytrium salamandrivorans]